MFDFKNFKRTLSILSLAILAIGFAGCGSSGGGTSVGDLVSEKTIQGVAIDAAGIAFATGTVVSLVDANGNTASGKVGADGAFSLLLAGTASSGKKGKEVKGSVIIQVGTGANALTALVGDGQDKVNINIITVAALNALGLDIDITSVIANAVAGGAVTNTSLLDSLARELNITKEEIETSANVVLVSIFGVDASGNPAVSAGDFLNDGLKADSSEIIMLQALANFVGDGVDPLAFISARVNASTVGSDGGSVLNDPKFYASISNVLATKEAEGKSISYENLINDVVTSNTIKDAVKTADLVKEIDALVTALVLDSTTDTTISTTVTDVAAAPSVITITVTRSGTGDDTITYSATNALEGDKHTLSAEVLGGSEPISIKVDLKKGAIGLEVDGDVSLYTGDLVIKLSTNAINATAGTIDLAVALAEVKAKLIAEKLNTTAGLIPASTSGRTLKITATAVVRGDITIKTFVKEGTSGTEYTSAVGVSLTSSLDSVSGTPVTDTTTTDTTTTDTSGFFKGSLDSVAFDNQAGSTVTTSSLAAVTSSGVITITTGHAVGSTGSSVSISVTVPAEVGSHTFTSSSVANIISIVVGGTSGFTTTTLSANGSFGSGSVVITEITSTVVKGTVNIVATDSSASATSTLTDGEFSITITAQ
ncbi:MAG: hypothetical protein COA79_12335 [Planctomycetota bacterium]|nr:MAG: hypothetical protein COA79_12335 [Planctomycetota bacterium]